MINNKEVREELNELISMCGNFGSWKELSESITANFIIIPRNELPECKVYENGNTYLDACWIPSGTQSEDQYGLALRYLARSEAYTNHAKEIAAKEAEAKAKEDAEAELAADWAVAEQLWDARMKHLGSIIKFEDAGRDNRDSYLAMARTARSIYTTTTKED